MRYDDKEEFLDLLDMVSAVKNFQAGVLDEDMARQVEKLENKMDIIRYRCNHYSIASPISVPTPRFMYVNTTKKYKIYRCMDCLQLIRVPIKKPNIKDIAYKCNSIKIYVQSMILQISMMTNGESPDQDTMKELSYILSVLDMLPEKCDKINEDFEKRVSKNWKRNNGDD